MIKEIFKQNNIKLTKPRENIYNTILNSNELCTFKYIEENCNKNINKVTIYRIIDLFLNKKIISKKISLGNEIYYEINNNSHIHYLTCVKCYQKKEISNDLINDFEKQILGNNKAIYHQIDFYILCSKCKKDIT